MEDMKNCKPLNIIYKKDINEIGNKLALIRHTLEKDNECLELDDIRLLRVILLGCLWVNILNLTDDPQIDNNKPCIMLEMCAVVDSFLGEGISEKYTDIPIEKLRRIRCEAALDHFKTIANIPMWQTLITYALEMLDYSEQDLQSAWLDRRSGVITKKKKQSGVYYTPPDVAAYMVNQCLDKLKDQYASLLSCRYMDCSCGSGVFLLQLIDCISEREAINNFEAYAKFVRSCVFGADVSRYAVECARYIIIQHSIVHFIKQKINIHRLLDDLNTNIIVADAIDLDTYLRQHSDYPSRYDCIIGNPPYAGSTRAVQVSAKSNLFIPFVYNLLKYASEHSVCSLVLPLSFAYNSQPGFRSLRQTINEDAAEWSIENYDRSPDSLFGDDVKARACIILRIKGTEQNKVCVSGLMRWTSTSRMQLLTSSKILTDITMLPITEYIPKLGCQIEKDAYVKITEYPDSLLDILKPVPVFSELCVVIKGTAYNWICAYDRLPLGLNADGSPYLSKDLRVFRTQSTEDRYFALAYLNSKIAFWLWTVTGDGFHVTNRLLAAFKIKKNASVYSELVFLGREFSSRVIRYPTISVNNGKTITSYDHRPLMETVDETDRAIAEALGLDKRFPQYLREWYSNIVSCGRDAIK
jgi:hypothetical protein